MAFCKKWLVENFQTSEKKRSVGRSVTYVIKRNENWEIALGYKYSQKIYGNNHKNVACCN